MTQPPKDVELYLHVSMKSGLEGRNNVHVREPGEQAVLVSMKSGLEGRNNRTKK